MITGLSYLMTSITVGLLLMIASRQPHESQNGVDVYRYPAALTRALAVLSPTVALMGVFVWHYASTKPTGTVSAVIVLVFGGITAGGLIGYWYFSSLRIEVTDRTLAVRTCWRTRIIDFKDVIDTDLIDGRSARGGNLQLVVYLKDGGKLRFYDTLTDFDDLSELVSYRMAGQSNGQEATAAKLKDIADRIRNKRREAWGSLDRNRDSRAGSCRREIRIVRQQFERQPLPRECACSGDLSWGRLMTDQATRQSGNYTPDRRGSAPIVLQLRR